MSVATTPFAPTHRTPAGGTDVWERPDPRFAPVTRLDSRLELQLLTSYEDGWAQVMADNGWTGWVDRRQLIALSDQPSVMRLAAHHFGVLGGALAILGTLFPWFTYEGASANAWEVPVLFLLAGTGDADQVKFGGFMLVMALLLLPYVIRRRLPAAVVWALASLPVGAASMAVPRHLRGRSTQHRPRRVRHPRRRCDPPRRSGLQQGAAVKRDEGGAFQLPVAMAITALIFVVAMAPSVIKDLTNAATGAGGWRPGDRARRPGGRWRPSKRSCSSDRRQRTPRRSASRTTCGARNSRSVQMAGDIPPSRLPHRTPISMSTEDSSRHGSQGSRRSSIKS